MRSSFPVNLVTEENFPFGLPNRLPSLFFRAKASFVREEIIERSISAESEKANANTFDMQNTHDFQKRSAKPGEFRDQQDILRLHGRKECAEFSVGEFFGGADGFFHPRINRQFLCIRVFEDFKPLIFRRLFIG